VDLKEALINKALEYKEGNPYMTRAEIERHIQRIKPTEEVTEIIEETIIDLPLCKTCGDPFEKTKSNQVNCQSCIDSK